MKFCFFFYSTSTIMFHRIAEELRRRYSDSRFSGFVFGRKWYRYLKATGFPYERLDVLTDYISDGWSTFKPDLDYLRTMESQYGIPNLWLYVTADRDVSHFSHQRILKTVEAHFRFFTDFFSRERPDVFISGAIAGMASFIPYVIGRRAGVVPLPICSGVVPGRIWFIHPDARVGGLKEKYQEYLGRSLSADERRWAEGFIREVREKRLRLSYIPRRNLDPPRIRFDPYRFVGHIYDYYVVERGRDFNLPTPGEMVMAKLRRVVRHYRTRASGVFEPMRPDEPFVVFPLSIDPEASTLVSAPFYIDQAGVAENIARSLPVGYKLYVKEHPVVSYGPRPIGFYRRLRRIANVRLMAPDVDSHELIQRSGGLVVMSSTMGWEAILHEKPVLTLGRNFFDDFEGVSHVHSIGDVPDLLRRVLTEARPDWERLVRFVLAVLNSTYPGNWIPSADEPDPENIRLIVLAIAKELGLGCDDGET